MAGKEAPVTLHIQSLRRMGKVAGITTQLNSIRDANPQNAANRLRDEAVPQLAKLHAADLAEQDEERVQRLSNIGRALRGKGTYERCNYTIPKVCRN